ncbi:unnamed protein product [Spodoptera littoralis]|uniref:Uncharacterized protein n=1 Tax=Spodoptera littoralis TaxID=7109 RepID=A0A9P0N009_SPOLI|nr:unnamed protein product [Spodoptera littoralis]CAH1634895.1 unnamed protein product [Spodoptera littoralis]
MWWMTDHWGYVYYFRFDLQYVVQDNFVKTVYLNGFQYFNEPELLNMIHFKTENVSQIINKYICMKTFDIFVKFINHNTSTAKLSFICTFISILRLILDFYSQNQLE